MHAPPAILYGTAWKEDRTEACVSRALQAGFRGFDTANQRRHYLESGTGAAFAAWFAAGGERDALFVQTKFTFSPGQDHRLPYDPHAPIATQVAQSFRSSLEHLGVQTLDSYVLHGPSQRTGLGAADWEAWRAMESLHEERAVAGLGISNVSRDQLAMLLDGARVPPTFVQNRCYAERGWDEDVRAVCTRHGVVYQGFSLLTANRRVWTSATVRSIAERRRCTPAAVVFRFARRIGILPLTGTTDPGHMADDLAAVASPALSDDDVSTLLGAGR